jgi:hypothetical protein
MDGLRSFHPDHAQPNPAVVEKPPQSGDLFGGCSLDSEY